MLGLALTFLLERFDRRLREPEDAEEAFGLPIVARIPASRALRRAASWRQLDLPPAEAEASRMLRANLRYFNDAEPIRSLVVTSAVSGEGKSTVALNLAFVEAQAGRRVLLIEANLRRPQLAERLELPGSSGLSMILAGFADSEEVGISLKSGGAIDPEVARRCEELHERLNAVAGRGRGDRARYHGRYQEEIEHRGQPRARREHLCSSDLRWISDRRGTGRAPSRAHGEPSPCRR